jgi:hypothetical protein
MPAEADAIRTAIARRSIFAKGLDAGPVKVPARRCRGPVPTTRWRIAAVTE